MKKATNLESALIMLKKVFGTVANCRESDLRKSKKWNTVAIANLILKINFKYVSGIYVLVKIACNNYNYNILCRLNKISACKEIILTMGKNDSIPIDMYPKSESVTYCYYQGRISMLSDAFAKVYNHLMSSSSPHTFTKPSLVDILLQ